MSERREIPQRLERREEGNGISNILYGFRKGQSTIDAVQEVARTAENGFNGKMDFCALVCIYIRNAFNFARWKDIQRALERKKTQVSDKDDQRLPE